MNINVDLDRITKAFDALLEERNKLWGEIADLKVKYERLLAAAKALLACQDMRRVESDCIYYIHGSHLKVLSKAVDELAEKAKE